MTKGSKATSRAEIYSIIEVQVQAFIILTGTALGFSCDQPMTSLLIPWPFIISPSSALYCGGVEMTTG